jgi:ABC-type protease/lipase transport system fused ATPase/permease subunit
MKNNNVMVRDELSSVLWQLRREFAVVGVFSMVVNLLMLTPTIYMLQVYDRVMVSQNHMTLLVVSGYIDERPLSRRSRAFRLMWSRRIGERLQAA